MVSFYLLKWIVKHQAADIGNIFFVRISVFRRVTPDVRHRNYCVTDLSTKMIDIVLGRNAH